MGHIAARRRSAADIEVEDAWLATGAIVADFCNKRAKRGDIVVRMGNSTVAGAPACFVPKTAELEVDVTTCFDPGLKPEQVGDLNDRLVRLDHPVATGVILHEASHARWTTWSLEAAAEIGKDDKKYGRVLTETMHWLEEGRIEALAVKTWPHDREMLRSSALQLALEDMDEDESGEDPLALAKPVELLKIACLTEARVVGKVIDAADIAGVTAKLEAGLGADRVAECREIFKRVAHFDLSATDTDLLDMMVTEATNLLDLLTDEELEEQQNQSGAGQGSAGNESGESGESGSIMDALREAADTSEINARGSVAEQINQEREAEAARAAQEAADERRSDEAAAGKVFGGKSSGPRGSRTRSSIQEVRQPSGAERAMAVRLSRDLERINYRERSVSAVNSSMPPGRLRSRAAVLGAAQRAQGIAVNAEPWGAKRRHHTESSPLVAGVMVDISGSMCNAMQPMATTAWVLSEAIKRVQGTAAMVYFGNSVFPTLKPHQHLDKVTVWDAPDGTEEFSLAVRALNGALDLTGGEGARVLFIVSDGVYRGDQLAHAVTWTKRMHEAGVAVVWVPFDRDVYGYSAILNPEITKRSTVVWGDDPKKVISSIGAAVVDTFKRVQAA